MDETYPSFFPSPLFLAALVAFWIALAVGNGFIARALGKHVALWVILSLIPIVNSFFYIYIGYSVVIGILSKLNALESRAGVIDT